MGTNFYARIIPSKERKKKLIELIEEKDFNVRSIRDEFEEMFGFSDESNWHSPVVHLGKRSWGWKFLWNPNWYSVEDGHYDSEKGVYISKKILKKYYDLTKESIKKFMSRPDIRIEDEYGSYFDGIDLFNELLEWDRTPWINGDPKIDAKDYYKTKNEYLDFCGREDEYFFKEYGFTPEYGEFYSDGLRFSTSTSFS